MNTFMKSFLVFVLFFLSIQLHAQIAKKTLLIGGNASMIISSSGNSFVNVNPGAGVFINNAICVGASASFILLNEDVIWGGAPFARYYFSPQKTQSIFASGSIGFSNLNTNIVGLSAGIGNVWFINKNIGIEAELKGSSDFEVISAGMYLGLQMYFNREKD